MKVGGQHKYSIYWRFLVPYMAILLMLLTVGTVIYYQTLSMVEEEVVNTNITLLDQSKDILDRRFQEVESIAQRLADDSKVVSFQHVTNPFQGSNTFRILDTRVGLYQYNLSNNFIMSYYLLFKNSDLALGTKLTYNLPDFYDQVLHYENMDYESWYSRFLQQYHKQYLPAMPASIRSVPHSVVTYIQSLGYPNFYNGAIVVLVDNEQIQTLLSGLDTSDGGWAYIADKEGRMISYVASGSQAVSPVELDFARTSGVQEQKLNGSQMLVTYTTSKYNGWKYVVVQPNHIVLEKVYTIKKIMVTVLVLTLMLGALIACIMAYRNSRPLRNLIRTITEQFEGEEQYPTKDAYGFIETTFSKLRENNEQLQERIKDQLPVLKAALFDRLLKGELKTNGDAVTQLQHLGIPFDGENYVVALLHFRGYDGMMSKDILEELDIKRMVVKDTINAIVHNRGYLHNVEEDKIALLLTCSTDHIASFKKEIEKVMARVNEELFTQIQMVPTVALGNPHGDLIGISRSFDEAKQALFYSTRKEREDLTWYCELPRESNGYYYPSDVKARLMNLAKAGEAGEADKIVQELYVENFRDRRLSLQILRLFIYELWGDLIKLVEQVRLDEAELVHIQAATQQLDEAADPEAFYRIVRDTYHRVCNAVHDRKRSHNTELKSAILELIHDRYTESSFGLAAVADLLHISEVFLSQFFKEQTGVNFYEYLNNLRMEQARELLLKTDLPVNEITTKVGYNSPNAFGRAFKRSHGISPLTYRRSAAVK